MARRRPRRKKSATSIDGSCPEKRFFNALFLSCHCCCVDIRALLQCWHRNTAAVSTSEHCCNAYLGEMLLQSDVSNRQVCSDTASFSIIWETLAPRLSVSNVVCQISNTNSNSNNKRPMFGSRSGEITRLLLTCSTGSHYSTADCGDSLSASV